MRDFVFYNPTRIIFGRKAADKIGEAVAAAGIRSALLIYGKGSVRTTGLYDRVRASLAQAGVEVEDLAGVLRERGRGVADRPCPRLDPDGNRVPAFDGKGGLAG